MRCPRCGGSLSEYRLEDKTAIECDACGYLDLAADLDWEPRPNESWDEALDRFHDRYGDDRSAYRTVRIGAGRYRVPVALYEEVQALSDEERAIIREFLRDGDRIVPNRSYTDVGNAVGVSRRRVGEVFLKHRDLLDALADSEVPENEA